MAGCGHILPESVIGQLLPADANEEASRKALNVIFDVGPASTAGIAASVFEAVTEQTGHIQDANWYGQLLIALSC